METTREFISQWNCFSLCIFVYTEQYPIATIAMEDSKQQKRDEFNINSGRVLTNASKNPCKHSSDRSNYCWKSTQKKWIICCCTIWKFFLVNFQSVHCFQLSNVQKSYYSLPSLVFFFVKTILKGSLFQAIRHHVTSSTQISAFVKTDRISIDRKKK